MEERSDLDDRLEDLGIAIPYRVRRALRLLQVAEAEIENAYPRGEDGRPTDPPGLFAALQPNGLFETIHHDVFRHHVRELIERSRSKKPVYSTATEAEVLLGLMGASKIAPLNSEAMVVVTRLFEKVVGKSFGAPVREAWAGQFEETLAEARRKVRTGR